MDAERYSVYKEAGLAVRYTSVATMTLFAYDYFTSLSDEVEHIWSMPLSVSKSVFLVNRLLPFVTTVYGLYMDNFADTACRLKIVTTSVLFCSSFVVAEVLLLLRVYALWRQRRLVLLLLVLAYVPATVIAYWSTIVFTTSASVVQISGEHGCLLQFENRMAWAAISSLLFFETFMLILIIAKYVSFRDMESALMQALYRDGVFFFISVLILSAVNLILLKTASPSLCYFFFLAQGALHSILSNHLVLRLRGFRDDNYPDMHISFVDSERTLTSTTAYFSSIASEETVLAS